MSNSDQKLRLRRRFEFHWIAFRFAPFDLLSNMVEEGLNVAKTVLSIEPAVHDRDQDRSPIVACYPRVRRMACRKTLPNQVLMVYTTLCPILVLNLPFCL